MRRRAPGRGRARCSRSSWRSCLVAARRRRVDRRATSPEGGSALGGGTTNAIAAPTATVPRSRQAAPRPADLGAARSRRSCSSSASRGQTADVPFFAPPDRARLGRRPVRRGQLHDAGAARGPHRPGARVRAGARGNGRRSSPPRSSAAPDSAFPGLPPLVAAGRDVAARGRPPGRRRSPPSSCGAGRSTRRSRRRADIGAAGGAWDGPRLLRRPRRRDARRARGGARLPARRRRPGRRPLPRRGRRVAGSGARARHRGVVRRRAARARRQAVRRGRPHAPAVQMSSAAYAGFDGVTPATLLPEAVELLRDDRLPRRRRQRRPRRRLVGLRPRHRRRGGPGAAGRLRPAAGPRRRRAPRSRPGPRSSGRCATGRPRPRARSPQSLRAGGRMKRRFARAAGADAALSPPQRCGSAARRPVRRWRSVHAVRVRRASAAAFSVQHLGRHSPDGRAMRDVAARTRRISATRPSVSRLPRAGSAVHDDDVGLASRRARARWPHGAV